MATKDMRGKVHQFTFTKADKVLYVSRRDAFQHEDMDEALAIAELDFVNGTGLRRLADHVSVEVTHELIDQDGKHHPSFDPDNNE